MTTNVDAAGPLDRGVRPDEELREKLRGAVAMLMLSIERAQREHPNTTIKLMLAAEEPDGSGHIAARFDNAEFIRDVGALVGYDKPTPKELAKFFIASHGLTVTRA